jgi:hypothetical protein
MRAAGARTTRLLGVVDDSTIRRFDDSTTVSEL